MNKIYESATMVVHDDREPITIDQAFDILWQGGTVQLSDKPDFSAENESDFFGSHFTVSLSDIIETNVSKAEAQQQVIDYLRYYDIYR